MATDSWPSDKPVFKSSIGRNRKEAANPPKDPHVSLEGKTVVITGCNSGLGLEAAVKYAANGCSHLVLGVRTKEKGEATKATILSRVPSYPANNISIQLVDYTSFASITTFAHALATAHPQIDILALNAGLVDPNFSLTKDGREKVVQVNYLSQFLLTILLLPTLIKTGETKGDPSRVVFTGSYSHLDVQPEQLPPTVPEKQSLREGLEDKANHKAMFHYGMTKLLLQMGVQSLTEQLEGVPHAPILVSVCPGACRTNIWNGKGPLSYMIRPLMWYIGRTAEEGSRTLVSAATLGEEAKGGFWFNDKLNEEWPNISKDTFEKTKKRDWEDCLNLLEGVEPQVKTILNGLRK
ncbi:Short chain dehydrogenase-like protein 27 [Elsinoe fawcettii]|nr:Short chain dehydrogenase-like protein 27 [Elsinoe fawcettii]